MSLRPPRKLQATKQYRSRVYPRSAHFGRKSDLTDLARFECGARAASSGALSLSALQVPGRHPGFKFFVVRLARRNSAKQSGSFARDDKRAFMSPSDDDDEQETDPRTNRADREIAGARGPAWDPQLNELQ